MPEPRAVRAGGPAPDRRAGSCPGLRGEARPGPGKRPCKSYVQKCRHPVHNGDPTGRACRERDNKTHVTKGGPS